MTKGVALFALMIPAVFAGNWPQWRGPTLDGISTEKNLPVKWDQNQNVTWKLKMPERSGATPIIWGDYVFLNVASGDNLEFWAVDRNKGTVLWKRPMGTGNVMMRKQNMSSPSPVTDGKNVWAMTGTGIFKQFDFKGNELWMRDIQKDYGKFGLQWGYASSPLLHGDSLYVQVLHGNNTDDPSYVMRIHKGSGKTMWRVERPTTAIRESPDSYTTPVLWRNTELVISGGDYVTGHDLATGKELWRAGGLNPDNNPNHRVIASPVVAGDIIYTPTRIRPLLAVKGGGRGDVSKSHRLWAFENGPDVPSPISDGQYFYSINDRGIVWCLDAKTGKEIYGGQRLKPAIYSSSPVLADGKIYISNEDGLTSVIKAGPQFEILAENHFNEYMLSSPAISDGQIFLRTTEYVYCIGKRQPSK